MEYKVNVINENTWSIEDGEEVRCFVLAGTEKALLVDGGMMIPNVREIAEGLCSLPMIHILTHADGDHAGAIKDFDTFYMHPSEAQNFYHVMHLKGNYTPIYEGDIIDLGDRPLEIVMIPGHTPGSIGILDINQRFLIPGDAVQTGGIFLFGVMREVHAYLDGLQHLDLYRDRFDLMYPSHGKMPVGKPLIDELSAALKEILADSGKYQAVEDEFFGTKVAIYDVGCAKFFMEPK